jgi:hypothetical protein
MKICILFFNKPGITIFAKFNLHKFSSISLLNCTGGLRIMSSSDASKTNPVTLNSSVCSDALSLELRCLRLKTDPVALCTQDISE